METFILLETKCPDFLASRNILKNGSMTYLSKWPMASFFGIDQHI